MIDGRRVPRRYAAWGLAFIGVWSLANPVEAARGGRRVEAPITDPGEIRRLAEALKDPRLDIRTDAAQRLMRVADDQEVPLWIHALEKNPYADVRFQAVQALGNAVADEAVRALRGALKDSDPMVRQQAALGLKDQLTPEVVEVLRAGWRDPDPKIRDAAGRTMLQIQDPAMVPFAEEMIRSDRQDFQNWGKQILQKLEGPEARNLLMTLAVHPPREELKRFALSSLGRFSDPVVVPVLEEAASRPGTPLDQVDQAMWALGRMNCPEANAAVGRLLNHPVLRVRWRAMEILTTYLPDRAIPVLVRALTECPHVDIRQAAILELSRRGDPAGLRAIESGWRDPHEWVRIQAAGALRDQSAGALKLPGDWKSRGDSSEDADRLTALLARQNPDKFLNMAREGGPEERMGAILALAALDYPDPAVKLRISEAVFELQKNPPAELAEILPRAVAMAMHTIQRGPVPGRTPGRKEFRFR